MSSREECYPDCSFCPVDDRMVLRVYLGMETTSCLCKHWIHHKIHENVMETYKQAGTPIPFVYCFELQNMQRHICCRAMKTTIIRVAYQSLFRSKVASWFLKLQNWRKRQNGLSRRNLLNLLSVAAICLPKQESFLGCSKSKEKSFNFFSQLGPMFATLRICLKRKFSQTRSTLGRLLASFESQLTRCHKSYWADPLMTYRECTF